MLKHPAHSERRFEILQQVRRVSLQAAGLGLEQLLREADHAEEQRKAQDFLARYGGRLRGGAAMSVRSAASLVGSPSLSVRPKVGSLEPWDKLSDSTSTWKGAESPCCQVRESPKIAV